MDELLEPGRLILPHNLTGDICPDFHLNLKRKNKQSTIRKHQVDHNLIPAGIHIDEHTQFILSKKINRVIGVLSDGPDSLILHAQLIGQPTLDRATSPNQECVVKIRKRSKMLECRIRKELHRKLSVKPSKNGISKEEQERIFEDKLQSKLRTELKRLTHWESEVLTRMAGAHIRVPKVFAAYQHVLFMSFLGNSQTSRPMFEMCEINKEGELYRQTIEMIHTSYNTAGIVPTKICTSNVLLDENNHCWFIDVGKSVNRNHPNILDVLIGLCEQVERLFTKRGGEKEILSKDGLLEYITGLTGSNRKSWTHL